MSFVVDVYANSIVFGHVFWDGLIQKIQVELSVAMYRGYVCELAGRMDVPVIIHQYSQNGVYYSIRSTLRVKL